MVTWEFLIFGILLVSIVLLGAGWYYYKRRGAARAILSPERVEPTTAGPQVITDVQAIPAGLKRASLRGNTVIIWARGREIEITVNPHATAAVVRAQIVARFGPEFANDFYVHKNRDDTFAVAFGAEPEAWPEDTRLTDGESV